MKILEITACLVFIAAFVFTAVSMFVCGHLYYHKVSELEDKLIKLESFKGNISKLNVDKLYGLEYCIHELHTRADNLRFCYLCPLCHSVMRDNIEADPYWPPEFHHEMEEYLADYDL